MKRLFFATALGIGLLATTGVYAADAPAGATAQCKDGTYYTGTEHKGACKGHQGVKTWMDKSDATASSSASTSTKSTAAASGKAGTSAKSTAAASDSGSGTPIAKCKDGTTFNGTSHRGACKGHKGVDTWLDTPAAGGAAATPTAAPAAKAAPAAAPAATPAPASTPAAAKTASTPTPASEIKAQPGGGAGKVWVNSASKVYHCQNDEWYGKTKEGSYMTEAQAKAGGNHAAHGKECGG